MREKGITQEELAYQVNMSSSTLNFKLNSKADFRCDEILKVCQVLNIDLEDISKYFFCQ